MKDENNDLLPCPFCGGKATKPFTAGDEDSDLMWVVSCGAGSANHDSYVYHENKIEAIELWNTRFKQENYENT